MSPISPSCQFAHRPPSSKQTISDNRTYASPISESQRSDRAELLRLLLLPSISPISMEFLYRSIFDIHGYGLLFGCQLGPVRETRRKSNAQYLGTLTTNLLLSLSGSGQCAWISFMHC